MTPFDWARIFRGATPWVFCLEVALRLAILYVVLVMALKAMGRRMSSQMTRNELLALVALAAAIGPAVQDPKRGVLAPIVVAVWVVLVQRTLALWTYKSPFFETVMQGNAATLCSSGTLDLRALRKNAISVERLFAQLRSEGITHLGAVERAYLEPDGSFTVLRREHEVPGLSTIPEWDPKLRSQQEKDETQRVCQRCGAPPRSKDTAERCASCGARDWTAPVKG